MNLIKIAHCANFSLHQKLKPETKETCQKETQREMAVRRSHDKDICCV